MNHDLSALALADTQPLTRVQTANTQSTANGPGQLASRHSRLLAVLPAGVVVIDGNGVVQEVNDAAKDLLAEPLLGQMWIDIIQRAFRPQPGDGHDMSLHDGRLVHISTNPLNDEPGQLVLLHDVTETRTLQNKVAHMQRLSAMGEVAARLAHQIRTPLACALLYVSPLIKETTGSNVKVRFAKRLRDSLAHMEQLIKNLLVFSRGDIAETVPVTVTEVLEAAAQQFKAQADAYQYSFTVQHQAKDSLIYACKDALSSAINNLLNNAKQACGECGEITLASRFYQDEHGQWVDIIVKDNGMGIAESDREKIMTPFYTTRSSGTGLGLAVVQSVSKAHNGYVWLDSKQGVGSRFAIRIPLFQTLSEQSFAEEAVAS